MVLMFSESWTKQWSAVLNIELKIVRLCAPGYNILAINLEGEDICLMYNHLGVSAFLLKYRVPSRPAVQGLPYAFAPLQDAQRAVGVVREGATQGKWGSSVNASKIGFTGFSAGGHLTGHISTAWRKRIYPRVDSADDVSCRPDFSVFMYLPLARVVRARCFQL